MKRTRFLLWIVGILILPVGVFSFWKFFLYDQSGKLFCHKAISLGFRMWCDDHTNAFPNVRGSSHDSLVALRDKFATTEVENNYRYVPGLRPEDPGDLVLMYYSRPTRWTLHILTPTIFEKKAWIVIPVDFTLGPRRQRGPGEESERLSRAEFRKALRNTLDFVRTNERPNWEAVVQEHTGFLESH